MSEAQLWYPPHGPEADPGRALRHATHALARDDAAPDAPTDLLSVRRSTVLESAPQRLLVGAQATIACTDNDAEIVGPLGKSRERLGAAAFCVDQRGAHVLATRKQQHPEDRPRLRSYHLPGAAVVGDVPIDKPEDVVDIQRFDALYLIGKVRQPPPHTVMDPKTSVALLHIPHLGLAGVRGRVGDVQWLGTSGSHGSSTLLARASRSGIVLATDLGVQWTDWALRPTTCWRVACYPHALAVSRRGEAALVADVDRSELLLAFDEEGKERFRVPMTQSRGVYSDHVVVDDDGRTVVSPPGWLLAFDREGSRRWAKHRVGTTPAVLLADGYVMFEHNSGLWIADRDGHTREVWRGSAPLATAPVEHDGHWFVATADTLLELR